MKSKDKIRSRLVLVAVVFFLVTIVGLGFYSLRVYKLNQQKTVSFYDNLFGWKYPSVKFPATGSVNLAYSDIRDPGGIPQGLPVRLQIPVIGVDSAIEDALITPDGRMDVPAGSVNVAWFALGPHPGQVGSAVIGGHFGIQNGKPFVFYKLVTLVVGDKIYVLDDKGNTLAFIVRDIKLFDRDADATSVFTFNDGLAHLNLITCEGIWNQVNGNYPQRRVIFTDAIPAEGVIIPKVQPIVVSSKSLTLGAKGAEVIALQTSLEQKGFLIMPGGVSKGYFGVLTRAAVAKYQKSAGLIGAGIFDALTKAKLASVPVVVTSAFPVTAVVSQLVTSTETSSSSMGIVQLIKSLYETPLDGLITSVLLILIVFIAWKIVRLNLHGYRAK